MFKSKAEKLMAKYVTGDQVEAFRELLKLTVSGKSQAEYYLASICSENGLRFLASDAWVDLLNHHIEPRDYVSRNQYETLVWLGDIKSAESFIQAEGLANLTDNLDQRDLVSQPEKLRKELAARLIGLDKVQGRTSYEDEQSRFEELKLRAGIAYICSQVDYSGQSIRLGNALLVSGSESINVDLDEYLRSSEALWLSLLNESVDLVRELLESEEANLALLEEVSSFAQDIQERMFFYKGKMAVNSDREAYSLSVIGMGLRSCRPVATEMYFSLIPEKGIEKY